MNSACSFSQPSQQASQNLKQMPSYYPKQRNYRNSRTSLMPNRRTKTNHSYVYKGFKVPTCPPVRIACQKGAKRSAQSALSQELSNQGQPQRYMMVNLTVQPKRQAAIMSPFKPNQQHQTACSVDHMVFAFTTKLKMPYYKNTTSNKRSKPVSLQ